VQALRVRHSIENLSRRLAEREAGDTLPAGGCGFLGTLGEGNRGRQRAYRTGNNSAQPCRFFSSRLLGALDHEPHAPHQQTKPLFMTRYSEILHVG
jgi:hypothetical protein